MPRKVHFVFCASAAVVVVGAVLTAAQDPADAFRDDDAEMMRWRMGELCTEEGVFFTGSGNCVNCHAPDPNGHAMVDENGQTVSPVVDWQATLMANSARDPFWRAKVAHEGLINPTHRESIENLCTACHAPQGFHEAHLTGNAGPNGYTMSDLLEDELGLDGVGCTACHGIDDINLAGRSNGDLPINPDHVAWGGFENPWDGLMSGQTGFIPAFGEHMRNSEVCASCHSLYTHTQDLEGEETGQVFFEQTTYLEWVNSSFNAENIQCQGCHMPLVEGGAIAATQPNWLFPQRFGKHHLVGGNAFMLKLMRDHAVQLDLSATSTQFDSTIARTLRSLEHETAIIHLHQLASEAEEWIFDVEVENLTGHKFPSGYPARVGFLEFVLMTSEGDTIFHSGAWSPEQGIQGRDEGWEPHWDVIETEDQVQIYELVFGDVTGQPTQVLERASQLIKDNRLPPRGFSTQHMAYDTVRIGPMASLDENFNRKDGNEGSGGDRVRYRIPSSGTGTTVIASVKMHYLAVPAQWVQSMFEFASESPEIASFQSMFNATDRTPIEVASASLLGVAGYDPDAQTWRIAPNPVSTGQPLRLIPAANLVDVPTAVELWETSGRKLRDIPMNQALEGILMDELPTGVYLLRLQSGGAWETIRFVKN